MLPGKVFELVTAEWVARLVFVSKKDGLLCICVNYRKLEDVTIYDL